MTFLRFLNARKGLIWLMLFFFQGECYVMSQVPHAPKREFRAVWIATINNIDWPSTAYMSTEAQKKEFINLLDFHKKNGMNAVVVQIRPAADAFYPSQLEPWSEWLTGKQGQPPSPYYDPLEFMIEEAHLRGMEFHAWINPFRAVSNMKTANIHPSHISKKKPEWFLTYGNLLMFNPGIPEARNYIVMVIEDMLRRYDLDGIHFDDYFYPYPEKDKSLDDLATFRKYGGGLRLADWRRQNVDRFIFAVHQSVQRVNPRVKFGISPFGVWRNQDTTPEGSPTRSGNTSYDHLYADVRLWLANGWIDYIAPQLYQSTRHERIPYKPLLKWWSENTFGRHLYVGHATYRVFSSPEKGWNDPSELPSQLRYNRLTTNVHGSVFYSSKSLMNNQGNVRDSLRANFYRAPALMPPMPWKDPIPPLEPLFPAIDVAPAGVVLSWRQPPPAPDGELPAFYVIYRSPRKKTKPDMGDSADILAILNGQETFFVDPDATRPDEYYYLISSLDRLHNESTPVEPVNFIPATELLAGLESVPESAGHGISSASVEHFSGLFFKNLRRLLR